MALWVWTIFPIFYCENIKTEKDLKFFPVTYTYLQAKGHTPYCDTSEAPAIRFLITYIIPSHITSQTHLAKQLIQLSLYLCYFF